jgi:phage tail-like protein
VLKRTVIKGDNDCFNWLNTVKLNQIERRDITVSLLNESHVPVVVWRFKNAFPVKLEYSSLDAHTSGPMMESMEITHEGMIVQNQN